MILKRRLGRELARRLAAEEALSVQARTDSLTGLPNRRHFDEVLEREWRRALRAGSWLGLLMIDVDHFKSYNDQFGHHVGDQTLAAIAQCIANTAQRATDFAARYGGEEFAVLLSGKEAQDAIRLAERRSGRHRRPGAVRSQAKWTQPRRFGRAAGGQRTAAAGGLAPDPESDRRI